MINETANLTSNVTVTDANGNTTVVMTLYASLDKSNMNMSLTVSTSNKELATANAAAVKAQYDEFIAALQARQSALGFVIV